MFSDFNHSVVGLMGKSGFEYKNGYLIQCQVAVWVTVSQSIMAVFARLTVAHQSAAYST
ncbi:hypothetical protein GCM10011403_20610 [Pseudohongiella nitratireducens]|uniref:Uncharacterized protein n=1 Tax=Pseudohongiella nitratireducens TaxID=1768907 RepID=A0A916VIR8_9GAMM|nr:hypothetical protein GCM10011403_20610 [Pseudohongiella nitratireducens]